MSDLINHPEEFNESLRKLANEMGKRFGSAFVYDVEKEIESYKAIRYPKYSLFFLF